MVTQGCLQDSYDSGSHYYSLLSSCQDVDACWSDKSSNSRSLLDQVSRAFHGKRFPRCIHDLGTVRGAMVDRGLTMYPGKSCSEALSRSSDRLLGDIKISLQREALRQPALEALGMHCEAMNW